MLFTPQLSQLLNELSYPFSRPSAGTAAQSVLRQARSKLQQQSNYQQNGQQNHQQNYAVTLWQNGDALELQLIAPGCDPAQFAVEVVHDQLTVQLVAPPLVVPTASKDLEQRAEAEAATEAATETATRATTERTVKAETLLVRQLRLPFAVDAAHAAATYKDGILRIQLQRAATAKPQKVAVHTS